MDEVWVPSEWQRATFAASGISASKLRVLPEVCPAGTAVESAAASALSRMPYQEARVECACDARTPACWLPTDCGG